MDETKSTGVSQTRGNQRENWRNRTIASERLINAQSLSEAKVIKTKLKAD